MGFRSLRFYNYRNLEDSSIPIEGSTVFLVGKNGQGKSNFLEAVYLLSFGSSFRVNKDKLLVKRNSKKKVFSLEGLYSHPHDGNTPGNQPFDGSIFLSYQEGQKKIEINGEKSVCRKELVNLIPSIVFCHGDISFVIGSPDQKRWFFNHIISQFDSYYLNTLLEYKNILRQRNYLLKNGKEDKLLEVYDYHLAAKGLVLRDYRAGIMDSFNDVFSDSFGSITGSENLVSVQYRPSWEEKDEESVLKRLYDNREKEYNLSTTTSGPHRDRYRFDLNGMDYSEIASTGQIRLLALILRISQAAYYTQKTGVKPLFLLDDVMLELDGEIRKRFIDGLPEYEQAFFTFLPEEPYTYYFKKERQILNIENGFIRN